VAKALSELAPLFHWSVTAEPQKDKPHKKRFIVVATQGQGDLEALKTALGAGPGYVAFVGSRRKYAALAKKLADTGLDHSAIDSVHAPAGLKLGAITPEEIALSILAQLVQERRANAIQTDA
jgi:xanthine dehydrogenase accessory factor